MIPLHVSDLYDKIKREKLSGNDLVNVLIENNTPLLQDVLYHAYSPELKYVVSGVPWYKNSGTPNGEGVISLEYAMRKISNFFMDNQNEKVIRKLNENLIQLLESMSGTEADLFISIMTRKLDYIPYEQAKIAFPGLLR